MVHTVKATSMPTAAASTSTTFTVGAIVNSFVLVHDCLLSNVLYVWGGIFVLRHERVSTTF